MKEKKSNYALRNAIETLMNGVFFACGIMAILFVAVITVYMFVSGIPAIRELGLGNFLLGTKWSSSTGDYGIGALLLSSCFGTLGAIIIGVPVGLLTAVFLSKLAPAKIGGAVSTAVELLAGIPSVVYGLIGMMVLVPAVAQIFHLSSGACLLAAILVLALMILPSIVSVSVTSLNAVPPEYEQGSLALGASEMETYFKVSIPAAKSGIAAGVVLGIGRAVGEAMAVMMVSGNVANMPALFKSVKFLTTAIASEMSYAGAFTRQALFSIGLILFLFIMVINAILNLVLKRGED